MVRKVIFYSLLNSDKLDDLLSEYESNGYILYKVMFRYIFLFKNRKTKTMGKYFSLYYLPRDHRAFNLNDVIIHSSANEIESYFSNTCYYRYTSDNFDVEKIRNMRQEYISYIYLCWLIVNFVLSGVFVFCFVWNICRQIINTITLVYGVLAFFSLLFCVIFIVRCVKSRRRCKRLRKVRQKQAKDGVSCDEKRSV